MAAGSLMRLDLHGLMAALQVRRALLGTAGSLMQLRPATRPQIMCDLIPRPFVVVGMRCVQHPLGLHATWPHQHLCKGLLMVCDVYRGLETRAS
jgi:hypothetical protein